MLGLAADNTPPLDGLAQSAFARSSSATSSETSMHSSWVYHREKSFRLMVVICNSSVQIFRGNGDLNVGRWGTEAWGLACFGTRCPQVAAWPCRGGALSALGGRPLRGLAASFALSACLPLSGATSFSRGVVLRRPIPGGGKIHHLSRRGGSSHAGDRGLLLVLARRRTLLRRSRSVLGFGSLLIRRSWLIRHRGCYHRGCILYHRILRFGRGGLFLHRESIFGGLYFSWLGGDCLPSRRREYSFCRQPPKNLLCCEIEKNSPMAGLWGAPLLSPISKTFLCSPYEEML